MRVRWKAVVLAAPLFLAAACGQPAKVADGATQAYSLCPKTGDARQKLHEQVRDFADQQHARLIDRSAGAQQELSGMGSSVLNSTGGNVILLTVEKSNEFRISVTNLGLEEKIALSVKLWKEEDSDGPVTRLMDDLGRFWTIQEVDGGIENNPPC